MTDNFHIVRCGDVDILGCMQQKVNLTFLDPPFNQGRQYDDHDDSMSEDDYWAWMLHVCKIVYSLSHDGSSIYFMQREKNADKVLQCLKSSKWHVHNLIIWKKLSSVLPYTHGFGKGYQIIVYATKGSKPATFNKLRIDLPLLPHQKKEREEGVLLTDVWTDIRELTSGYLAGGEAFRDENGKRLHKQQSPISLLLRIILCSTMPGDVVLDPFGGTGTSTIVCFQLERSSVYIDNSVNNYKIVLGRMNANRAEDDITKYVKYYRYTHKLPDIWSGAEKYMKKEITIEDYF